jgi:hypothetical protein
MGLSDLDWQEGLQATWLEGFSNDMELSLARTR